MSSLLEMLTQQIGGDTLGQISRQIGADEKTTGVATGAALSAIVGALARNTAKPEGARSLHAAVRKDHDGSVLNDLKGLVGGAQAGPGDGILRHVLGGKRQGVEAGLSQATGLDKQAMGKLMAMLAPMVLGAVGKQQRAQNLSADSLSSYLNGERKELERKEPQARSLLGSLLDTDGDGDVDMGDMAKHGAGLLGKLFRR